MPEKTKEEIFAKRQDNYKEEKKEVFAKALKDHHDPEDPEEKEVTEKDKAVEEK
ncbi:hypothetical protein [Enterococcus timonensis]|uniref:hypothetical protein n=1 Tax=Enterococcus timonensis TaxID=1852364 RepID=UPI0013BE9C45|nr:hypothetical protein [Enterococcus timonensis]